MEGAAGRDLRRTDKDFDVLSVGKHLNAHLVHVEDQAWVDAVELCFDADVESLDVASFDVDTGCFAGDGVRVDELVRRRCIRSVLDVTEMRSSSLTKLMRIPIVTASPLLFLESMNFLMTPKTSLRVLGGPDLGGSSVVLCRYCFFQLDTRLSLTSRTTAMSFCLTPWGFMALRSRTPWVLRLFAKKSP